MLKNNEILDDLIFETTESLEQFELLFGKIIESDSRTETQILAGLGQKACKNLRAEYQKLEINS